MKPNVSFGNLQTTDPYWWGTRITDSRTTLPGGGQLNASTFPTGSDNKKFVKSGTLIARIFNADPGSQTWVLFTSISDPTTVVELAVVLHDIPDVAVDNLTDLVAGNGANILYYNYLPEWSALTDAQKQVVVKFFIPRRGLP